MRPAALLFGLVCCLHPGGDALAASAAPPAAPTPVPILAPAGAAPAIGEETSLAALTQPHRFAWPARFTCRFDEDGRPERSLTLQGASFAELNEKLAVLNVMAEDCRGGFSIESLEPQAGKLDRIIARPPGRDD
jgi:hypothetical protein